MEIPKEMLDRNLQKAIIQSQILENPEVALEFMETIVSALKKHKENIDEKNSSVWLIVRNIKPEHLAELRKLIVPEVFTNLGLD